MSLLCGLIMAVATVACAMGAQAATPSQLVELQMVPRYDREAFGDGWADLDGDCQDTRNEVLVRDLDGERLDWDGCRVLSGTLHDPYTGKTISFVRGRKTSDAVQIDHIVPLSYAWRAGAWRWSDAERLVFANDEANLLAVDGPTNNGKGDAGPAEWLPPSAAARCDYVAKWVDVLRRYDLTPSRADATALHNLTEECH